MFGDDFFGGGIDELFNRLAGSSFSRSGSQVRSNNNMLSVVGDNKNKVFVFDLSGKKFNSVEIKDDLEVNDYGEEVHNGNKILEIRFNGDNFVKYTLPKELRKRSMSHTFKNGILEVRLSK